MIWRCLFYCLNYFPMSNSFFVGKLVKKSKNKVAKKILGACDLNCTLRPKIKLKGFKNIYIGKNSGIGDQARIIAKDQVFIGENVLMAPEVVILTENHVINGRDPILTSGTKKAPVFIGDDVWIGTRVIILPGAKIPNGCVVAAGAVVPAKIYPPYSIIGGIPAQVIKQER